WPGCLRLPGIANHQKKRPGKEYAAPTTGPCNLRREPELPKRATHAAFRRLAGLPDVARAVEFSDCDDSFALIGRWRECSEVFLISSRALLRPKLSPPMCQACPHRNSLVHTPLCRLQSRIAAIGCKSASLTGSRPSVVGGRNRIARGCLA